MLTLSVILIVKNEAKCLARCLQSVQSLADEMIVLDSGSSDETLAIAQSFQAKCFVNADWQGFGKQRQLAQSYATGDYVLWLDADEEVSAALAKSIQAALAREPKQTAFSINRLSWAFGRFIRHGGWYPDEIIRLYRREEGRYSDDAVHEKVLLNSGVQTEKLAGDLLHYTYEHIAQYLQKSAHYAQLWAMQRHQQGQKSHLFNALTHSAAGFVKSYFLKAGFLDGSQGLLLAVLSAHSIFAKYAQLWLLNNEK